MNDALSSAAPHFGGNARSARRALWTMLRQACYAATVVHVVFLLVFVSLGLRMLVWANLVSIALFLCSAALLSRHQNATALSLIVGEVVLHAAAASMLLGWDSGFHYYLLTMVAPLMVGMSGTTTSKLVRLLAFGAAYAALDAWTRRVSPVYPVGPVLLELLRYSNMVGMLAIMAFVALNYARQMASAERALQALASTDALTGLHNRRRMLEIARTARVSDPAEPGMCVLLCDIDHFKHVNDEHGHDMGDLVLQGVAAAIAGAVRTTDSVARWGGEEFVVLLPGADLGSALQTAERIRWAVSAMSSAATKPLRPIAVTITIGVARVDPADTLNAAIARADAALYRGKAAGRDRVVAAANRAAVSPVL